MAPQSNPQFANFANLVATALLADQVGSVAAIPNALASGALDTAILVDPVKIEAYQKSIADQMNAQSGGPTFTDLSERVADLIINTTAQGAGTLEVHLIDPQLLLLVSGFIQADENGYLWPPIDINFPSGSDCVWRLCQSRFTNELSDANLILTFEDRIVSLLRERGPANGGIRQGQPNQTLGGFIKELVDDTNFKLKPHPKIRLLELIDPQDPNYTVPITQIPGSAVISKLNPNPVRTNPNRANTGLTDLQRHALKSIEDGVQSLFGGLKNVSLAQLESEGHMLQAQGLGATGPGSDLLNPSGGLGETGVGG